MNQQPVYRSVDGLQHLVMTAFEWGRMPKEYRGVVEQSEFTGWPVGTKTALHYDKGTCLVPVIVDPLEATKENATLVGRLIEEALARLGPTTADAAAYLRDLGIKGKRRCAGECVLYNYLMEHGSLPEFGDSYYMQVAHPQVSVWHKYEAGARCMWVDVRLPEHLRGLTVGFDEGQFPELDQDPDEIEVRCPVGEIEVYQGGKHVITWSTVDAGGQLDDGLVYDAQGLAVHDPIAIEELKASVTEYCRAKGVVR